MALLGDGLLGSGSGSSPTWESAVAALSPIDWLRLRETSGTSVANSGSRGTAYTLNASEVTVGQVGQLGANEAFDWIGGATAAACTGTNGAAIQGLTDFTVFGLIKPDSAGGSSAGRIWEKGSEISVKFGAASRTLNIVVFHGTTNANYTSTTIVPLAWCTVAGTYEGTGKTCKLYINGAEVSYSGTIPGVGSRTSNTNVVCAGCANATSVNFNGLIDELFVVGSVLDAATIANLHSLTGL